VAAFITVCIAIQFIQPERNKAGHSVNNGFDRLYNVPDAVSNILHVSCYDCHSDYTNYPWYAYVQPVGWVLRKHINKGKAELNFDAFQNYTLRKRVSKLKMILDQVKENKMPIESYTWIHKKAVLSADRKTFLAGWLTKTIDSLSIQ
jgi:hypothetical protein